MILPSMNTGMEIAERVLSIAEQDWMKGDAVLIHLGKDIINHIHCFSCC